MPLTDSSEGFAGLRQWSEPLIFDRLFAAYGRLLRDETLARSLSRVHACAWRALVVGDGLAFEASRVALVTALGPTNLAPDHLAEVDAEIVTELLDVVASRYSRSQRVAASYHLALMEILQRLRPARAAALRAAA